MGTVRPRWTNSSISAEARGCLRCPPSLPGSARQNGSRPPPTRQLQTAHVRRARHDRGPEEPPHAPAGLAATGSALRHERAPPAHHRPARMGMRTGVRPARPGRTLREAVTELGDCTDEQLAQHLSSARALLFPSLIEGYGLPLSRRYRGERRSSPATFPSFGKLAEMFPIFWTRSTARHGSRRSSTTPMAQSALAPISSSD